VRGHRESRNTDENGYLLYHYRHHYSSIIVIFIVVTILFIIVIISIAIIILIFSSLSIICRLLSVEVFRLRLQEEHGPSTKV
jgi:hypothetical protein